VSPPRAVWPPGRAGIVLDANGLTCRVESRLLWSDLALRLIAGERLGVTGPSGSGKTMLLRVLCGLEPIVQGTITFRERPLDAWAMPEYRARVMYVPQRPLLREGSVQQALRAPFAFRVHSQSAWDAGSTSEWLARFGRDGAFLRQRCERVSGGETQILALVRALALAPQVLLLDEPTASMDREAAAAAERLIGDWLHARADRACLWVSHDGAQLARTCDRLQAIA
jgi:putative ABC transport system ATP-binding protein